MPVLSEWNNFYMLLGSCAGALIGLQFVVLTVAAQTSLIAHEHTNAAFSTPTITHFGCVLLMSALITLPWHDFRVITIILLLLGSGGMAYVTRVTVFFKRQPQYKPCRYDWVFHIVFPSIAYTALTFAATALLFDQKVALFGVAAAALTLLFVSIHNAWDSVLYILVTHKRKE
jgi:hypothetical protein